MNLDELTIGEAKQLAGLLGGQHKSSITQSMIGKYVIVRSRNEGINSGYVEKADDTGIILTDARRIWYHKPANKSMAWYEGVAASGLSADSKISEPAARKAIIEDYSIVECSDIAIKSIKEHVTHGQN